MTAGTDWFLGFVPLSSVSDTIFDPFCFFVQWRYSSDLGWAVVGSLPSICFVSQHQSTILR